jgi:hypothetical protein
MKSDLFKLNKKKARKQDLNQKTNKQTNEQGKNDNHDYGKHQLVDKQRQERAELVEQKFTTSDIGLKRSVSVETKGYRFVQLLGRLQLEFDLK